MTARIHNANLPAVHRTLAVHTAEISRQIGMLSSGLRINRSSDDPASVALADDIASDVRAMVEGSKNIQQTFSLIQMADGSLNEISEMVNRMRALAMQGSSSSFNEIDRIAGSTTYNGRELLTGGNNTLSTASTALTESANTGLTDISVTEAVASTFTFVDSSGDGLLELGNGVQTQSVSISDFLEDGAVPGASFFPVRFERLGIEVTLTGPDVVGAPGQYVDGALDGQTLIVDKQDRFTFQVGPAGTSNDVTIIRLADLRATGLVLNLGDLALTTQTDATRSLTRLGSAIQSVSAERSRLAAFQNRLQLSPATSQSVLENMVNRGAEIREVDVARAASRLARSQILAQAATSIAGEADADIGRILSLLQ